MDHTRPLNFYTIFDSDGICLTAEFCGDFWVLHCTVEGPWTKSRLLGLRTVLRMAAAQTPFPVYAFQTPSCDPLKRKFITQCGGVWERTMTTDTGQIADMYRFLP